MSEQKYYVRLDTEKYVKRDFSNSPYSPSPDYIFWIESDGNFGYNKHTFTLLELEKISQEKLARDCGYDDLSEISLVGNIVGDYWVNPLIELVPVENV